MRSLILSVLFIASTLQAALGQTVEGQWTYIVDDLGAATITASTATGAVTIPSVLGGYPVNKVGHDRSPIFGGWWNDSVTSITIPSSVTSIGEYAFISCIKLTNVTFERNSSLTSIQYGAFLGCVSLTSFSIPSSVTSIESFAFQGCNLTSVTIPPSVTSIGLSAFSGNFNLTSVFLPSTIASSVTSSNQFPSTAIFFIGTTNPTPMATQTELNAIQGQLETLATNTTFINNLAQAILSASNHYGLATQSSVTTATSNLVTQAEITTLATKTELTSALAQSRTDGINSVLSNPNLWTLYTTNQIKNMAIGDLVLTRTNNGQFILNYDIEQSEDLANWTPYAGFAMPLTNLPTDKAFVRIKAKQ